MSFSICAISESVTMWLFWNPALMWDVLKQCCMHSWHSRRFNCLFLSVNGISGEPILIPWNNLFAVAFRFRSLMHLCWHCKHKHVSKQCSRYKGPYSANTKSRKVGRGCNKFGGNKNWKVSKIKHSNTERKMKTTVIVCVVTIKYTHLYKVVFFDCEYMFFALWCL